MFINLSRPGFWARQDMPNDGDEWIGYDRMVEIVREHNDRQAREEQINPACRASFEEDIEKAYWEYDSTRKGASRSDRDWFKRAIRMHIGLPQVVRIEMPDPVDAEDAIRQAERIAEARRAGIILVPGSPIEKRLCKLETIAERMSPGILQHLEDESLVGRVAMDVVKHPDGTSTVVDVSFTPSAGPVPDYTGEGSAWVPPKEQVIDGTTTSAAGWVAGAQNIQELAERPVRGKPFLASTEYLVRDIEEGRRIMDRIVPLQLDPPVHHGKNADEPLQGCDHDWRYASLWTKPGFESRARCQKCDGRKWDPVTPSPLPGSSPSLAAKVQEIQAGAREIELRLNEASIRHELIRLGWAPPGFWTTEETRLWRETQDELKRCRDTLTNAGFTNCGGELWKPPVGPSAGPLLDKIDGLQGELDKAKDLLAAAIRAKGDAEGRATMAERRSANPLTDMAREIIEINTANGWNVLQPAEWGDTYKVPGILALVHSEVSEALEAFRRDDQEHFLEELADVVIRVLDCSGGLGLNIDAAIRAKLEKNKTRGFRHGGKRV